MKYIYIDFFLLNWSCPAYIAGADTGKNEPPQTSRFSDFIQYFPDFSLTKFLKARKCERCGSLNPRLPS